jgi:hypothetical protein
MPSRFIRIRNIASLVETRNDQVFSDLYSDIMDKCAGMGKVLEIKVPRPTFVDKTA